MPLSAGIRLGPYEILSALGAGGMGEIYRARDTRLDRTVAIKILPEHLSGNPQLRERFDREAKAISSLSHPHICPLYDVGHQDGIDYLVMEYLEGQTLADRLKRGPLPTEQALQYAIQITDALDTAHKHAVIHRDLKPGNIMLTKSVAKLLDFGLAKVRATVAVPGMTGMPTQTTPLTREGTILGTLQYMAPEQLEGGDTDARTDIFALGAVIYEMATGRKAFEGKSQASLISAIMSSEPPALSTIQAMAPLALDHVVKTCLAKDPDARWQTAHDVLVELKWIAGGGEAPQVADSAATLRFRKHAWLHWIVEACLLVALIAGWVMVQLRQAPESRAVRFEVTAPEHLGAPVVSPDGQYVAVSVSGDPQSRIWLHPLNSLATNPLPGTEGGQFPFWSPDSRQIGFSTASGLKKMSLTGGTPQTICNLPARGSSAWNRDGVILFWPGANQPLYEVNAMGGEPKPLTKLDGARHEIGHLLPAFLPGGRHFTYLSLGSQPATYLRSLDSPEAKRVHDGAVAAVYAAPGYLIFVSGPRIHSGEGTIMAQPFDIRKEEIRGEPTPVADSVNPWTPLGPYGSFSVSENGVLAYEGKYDFERTQLVWFDRTGKRLGTVGEPAQYSNPAISPDQKKVAVGKVDPQTKTRDIWVMDLQRGSSSRLTFDPGDDMAPAWSPDGTRIAFSSDRTGKRDIYVKPANGVGEERALVESAEMKSMEDWSADGQYLLYEVGSDEWLFSFRGQKSTPIFRVKSTHRGGRFFPNGGAPPRWIAYSSDEAGTRQVYVSSFAGAVSDSAGKWQISTNGGSEPYWRGDGKELFYLNGNKLMAVEVNPEGQSFQPGIPKELFEKPLSDPLRNRFVATSDGKRFLMNVLMEEKGRAGFTVVLNWPSLLKR